MNPFKGRHFQRDISWYWRNPSRFCSWHIDETYVKVNVRWAYLYRAVDSRGRTIDFYLSSRRNIKAAYRFLRLIRSYRGRFGYTGASRPGDHRNDNERPHQGKMCCARTPMETLLNGKHIWAEKDLSHMQSDRHRNK